MRQEFIRCKLPFLALLLLPVAASAQPIVWTTDSLTRTSVGAPAGSGSYAQVYAALGEAVSFQIVIQAPTGGLNNVNVTMSDLYGPGGATIASSSYSLFRENYVLVSPGSVNWNGANQPLGAGVYPDGLIPFTDPNTGNPIQGAAIEAVPFNLGATQNQPIWVDVNVPRTATPGTYSGTYTVTANQGNFTGSVSLTVWHFALPVQPALKSAFLYWSASGVEPDEELLRNRVSPLRSDPSIQNTLQGYGLQTVGLPFYSGGANGYCTMEGPPSVSSIQSSMAQQAPGLIPMVYSTDEIANCTGLYPLIQQWGYNLHQAGAKNLVTMPPIPALFDDGSGTGHSAVDYWAVMGISYNPNNVATAIGKGDEVWSYTALVQDSYSPKWEIDFSPINFRIQPGFLNQSLGMTGLLYWAVDKWITDPWNQVNNVGWYSGNNYPGEGILVYPGVDVGVNGVVPSMRLKWIRDGSEDYDYIQMLRNAGDGSWAMGLVNNVAPDWTNWTRDTGYLQNVRLQMGQALDQIYGGSGSAAPVANTAPSAPATPSMPNAPSASGEVAPGVSSIVPSNNGNRTTFTVTVADGNGANDLAGTGVMVTGTGSGANACWFYYNLNTSSVSLAYDDGSTWATVAQGSGSSISNSQCSVAGTDFGAVKSGNSATITVSVTFNPQYFAGTKALLVDAVDNENESSGYQSEGMWTLGGDGSATASAPASPALTGFSGPGIVSVVPVNSGNRTTFTVTFADANGSSDLAGAGVMVAGSNGGANACWFYYNLDTASVSLAYDDGSTWAVVPQGSGATISNSQCSVAGTDFGAVKSGNSATITVAVTFNPQYFAGTKTLLVNAVNHENESSGYVSEGKWMVP